jgi:cytochrome d ubiquinol oxidase subunit II
MAYTLPLVFAFVVAFAVGLYVILDGFDLGIGILFPFAPGDAERDIMMNSVGPVWDGNETWLVLGGTLLFAAFPAVYAQVLPAFYIPLMTMLFALVFRGIAFEYRFRARGLRWVWDWAFAGGSALAALMQGVMLGAFIDGVKLTHGRFAGSPFGFASVFALASGLGVVAGYALLGATWTIFKTEGTTQAFARRAARWALVLTLGFIGLISLWTPLTHEAIAERWFSRPNIFYLWPVPLVTAALAYGLWRAIAGRRDGRPFLLAILLFLVAYGGLGISLWPYAVPRTLTIWEAAGTIPTLIFLFWGTVFILPLTLGYLGYAHWVFRGKTRGGYEH